MAHWIIEDYGFGGQNYMCSNCRSSWNDIYDDVLSEGFCPECGESINEDEVEYFEEPMRDYFMESIIPDDVEGVRPDIAKLINDDVRSYREHMIKQYNGVIKRATDKFCFMKFLNEYTTAINVFGLHKEYNCRGSFNRFINGCWQEIRGNDEI